MYVLDTNILSELMRPKPDMNVLNWLDRQYADELYITAITLAEIRLGIALLPDGKRKEALSHAADQTLEHFTETQLDFTGKAAQEYANIIAKRTEAGRPISIEDAQIAAITQVNDAVLVTRNVKDFDLIHIKIINPFDTETP